jgi:phage terminase large subunit-like protein
LTHTGDSELRQHVKNANYKMDEKSDNKLRIIKGRGPVDACVALSMAVDRIMYLRV